MLQLRLQTAFLLLVGQVLLGGLGWFLSGRLPWVGLLTTLFLLWFAWRLGLVFRDEAERRTRRYRASTAAWTAFLSQAPGLLLLHYWAPDWIHSLWQGAFLPAAALLDRYWPGTGASLVPWLWLTAPLLILLFTRPARAQQTQEVPVQRRAPGEWVPARRLADVQKRGLKVR
ncbi:hypothetical protein J2Z79_000472 [Symbiobacterium terraclitae]|jgi:hypothetical protein|uniref:Uncharacterized protein n=1 Tax=Symbiobacterium terraclitae TaxID=557451 RepID=A0ABS4JNI7_9FIRM|nr:hypothetical protein [Symbiobacterium terraclitae]MBP2017098.1 hypothetical protein [Symbiobacterium terraclitae]